MGEYVDNLKFPQLDRNNIKDALVQKEIISAQQKESTLYKEVLKNLAPKQIAQLIQKNYTDKQGNFLAYNKIQKDYAYYFLTQTALAMVGYDCAIDGYDWPNMRMCVRQFEIDQKLPVDKGFAGPQVLSGLVRCLTTPHEQMTPIETQSPREVVSQKIPQPPALDTAEIKSSLPSAVEYKALKDNMSARQRACFVYLHEVLWFTPIVTAWILGNIYAESKFSTTARGDRGRSHGLCQWQGPRWTNLKNFAQRLGTTTDNYQTQLAFIKHELATTEKSAGRALASATTVKQATEIFLRKYERASIPHTQRRTDAAHVAYQQQKEQENVG